MTSAEIVDGQVIDSPEPTEPAEWVFDDAARARVTAALADIDRRQADYPTCVVCGQRCIRLDRFGCCSKVSERSEPHRVHRAEMKARDRA